MRVRSVGTLPLLLVAAVLHPHLGAQPAEPAGMLRSGVGPGQGPRVPYLEIEWRYWWWLNFDGILGLRPRLGLKEGKPRIADADLQAAIPALLKAARAGDPALQAAALLALAGTRDERAADALQAGLQDASVHVRRAAILGLGVFGRAGSLSALEAIVRNDKWEARERATAAVALGLIEAVEDPPLSIAAFDPSGQSLLTGGSDGWVRAFDAGSGALLWSVGPGPGPVKALSVAGGRVAVGFGNGAISMLDLAGGGAHEPLSAGSAVTALGLSGDGRVITSAATDVRTTTTRGTRVHEPIGVSGVYALAHSPDGRHVAVIAGDSLIVLDARTGEERARATGVSTPTLAWSPDSERVLFSSAPPAILALATGTVNPLPEAPPDPVHLGFLDGSRLLAAYAGGALRVLDAGTGRVLLEPAVLPCDVVAWSAAPKGEILVAGSDRWIRRLDLGPATAPMESGHDGPLLALDWSPRSDTVVTAGADGACRTRPVKLAATIATLLEPEGPAITAVAFDPRGERVACGDDAGVVRVVSLRTRKVLHRLTLGEDPVTAVAFSADGDRIAAGGGGQVALWFAGTGRESGRLDAGGDVLDLTFHPQEAELLAVATAADSAALWSARDRIRIAYVADTHDGCHALAFAPDGAVLAAAVPGGTVLLSEGTTGATLGAIDLGSDVRALAASADHLAAVLADGSVTLADASSGAILAALPLLQARDLAFSASGDRLAVARADGTLQVIAVRGGLSGVKLRPRSAATVLSGLLADPSTGSLTAPVASGIAWGAGLTRDPALVPPLVEHLRRRNDPSLVRAYAALALGHIEHADAAAALIEYLDDRDVQVRRSAAIAVGRLLDGSADDRAVSALLRQERSESEQLARILQRLALARIGGAAATRLLAEDLMEKPLSRIGNVVGPPRVSLSGLGRAPFAALGLGIVGLRNASPLLAERLQRESDTSVRSALALGLGLIGDARMAQGIREAMADTREPRERGYCAIALGLLRYSQALPDLERMLQEEDDIELLPAAAIGLALIDPQRATPALLTRLRRETNGETQRALLYALGLVGDENAAPAILDILRDDAIASHVRVHAAIALGHLAESRLLPPLQRLRNDFNYTLETEHMQPPSGWLTFP